MTRRQSVIGSFFTILMIISASALMAQSGTDQVRLFQSYFFDTPIATTNHVQPGLSHSSYEHSSILTIGANGGYVVNPKLEVLGGLDYISISYDNDNIDGQSGLSDLALVGRYKLTEGKPTQFAAGALLTLPIGSDDIGAGNLDFGGFAAVRHPLKNGMVVTGNVALLLEETINNKGEDDRESSLELAGGVIYPMNNLVNIVGELTIKGDKDYMLLSGGVDYVMGNGHLRGALGIGLDDAAPDFRIMAGYLLPL
jgi:hypothetical protein